MQQIKTDHIFSLWDLLCERADLSPESTVLTNGETTHWTYKNLKNRVDKLVEYLSAAGVQAGQRVLIVGENSPAFVTMIFAVNALKAWGVVVNGRLTESELEKIATHSAASFILFAVEDSRETSHHAKTWQSSHLVPHEQGQTMMFAALSQAQESVIQNDVAVLIYTSGTTGTPKGVMLTNRNLLFVAEATANLRQLVEGDVVFGGLPLSHAYGLSSVLLATIWGGSSLYLEMRPNATALEKALTLGRVSVMLGVPTMYVQLLSALRLRGDNGLRLPRLRYLSCGGAPLDGALKNAVQIALGVDLQNGYGLTESSPTISVTRVGIPYRDGSVGFPLPGVEVQLRGIGELWVRGPNIMKGYFRDPEQTAKVLDSEGWFNTQDLVEFGPEGDLFIRGRTKELIIRSGFNVYPAEVEAALHAHPAVEQSAVIGLPQRDNEEVLAFVVLRQQVSTDELLRHLKTSLAAYKLPSAIHICASLPKAPNGKILKIKLLEQFLLEQAGSI